MENGQIAEILDEIADLLELKEANDFRVRSYRSAALTARGLSQRLEDLDEQGEDLSELPNIGKSTAEKIHEILETGTCQRLEDLHQELPDHLTEVMKVPGLGGRKTKLLYDQLGIKSLKDLEKACQEHRVRDLENMGEKTEKKILKGIQTLALVSGRILLKEAAEQVESLGKHLSSLPAIKRWEIAGSFRRGKETVGDLDILIHAADREEAIDAILEYPEIARTDSRGTERVTAHLQSGVQVDFRFFEPKAFGSALLYFTGSKAQPNRLDLLDTYCQRAKEAGVGFTISTDAHQMDDLELIRFGVQTARRGWLEKQDVLNTSTQKTLRKRLQS